MRVWFSLGTLALSHSPKNMNVRMIGEFKLTVCVCMMACLVCLCVGPVMDCQPCLLPDGSWDRLQPPMTCHGNNGKDVNNKMNDG